MTCIYEQNWKPSQNLKKYINEYSCLLSPCLSFYSLTKELMPLNSGVGEDF